MRFSGSYVRSRFISSPSDDAPTGNASAIVAVLAGEFLDRLQAGEQPSIDSYCNKYPELAGEIREVISALVMVEDLKPHSGDQEPSADPHPRGMNAVQIGGYRILHELGRGGMGIVFEAEQQSLNRRVALKVLSAHGRDDASAMARFESEARAAARMHHTNIVPVFEVGKDNGHMFYAMQLIRGKGLDKVIQDVKTLREKPRTSDQRVAGNRNPQPPSSAPEDIATLLISGEFQLKALSDSSTGLHAVESIAAESTSAFSRGDTGKMDSNSAISAVLSGSQSRSAVRNERLNYCMSVARIGEQVADALEYAHGRGVIHRDIKPSNLMLDAAGTVWVTDFGLAKTSDASFTHTGDILGTLRYMSPERFQGECDARADLYSLGLTLYEMLVLQPAFHSPDRLQLIELVTKSSPPAPRSLEPQIPRDLEIIVLKCIAPVPRHRYQTAADLAAELRRFLAGDPILARAIGPLERFSRWCRRNPLPATLSVLTAVSLFIGTLVSTSFAFQASSNAELAERRAADIQEKQEQTVSLLEEVKTERRRSEDQLQHSQRLLNLNRIQSAFREWQSSHAATAWRYLNAYEGNEFDWEYHYLRNMFQRNHSRLDEHPDDVNAFDLSPDESRLITATGGRWKNSPHGEVRIYDRQSGEQLMAVKDFPSRVTDVAFHPDGSRFVTCCMGGNVQVRDSVTGQLLQTLAENGPPIFALNYNHDGSRIVCGANDGAIIVWDAMSGRPLHRITGHAAQVADVEFSPDSSQIASVGWDDTVKLWNAHSGELVRTMSGHLGAVYCVAFDASGTRIASGCWDSEVIIWDAQTGNRLTSLQSRTLAVYGVAFSPDGSQLASGSYDQKIRLWNTATGQLIRTLEGHTGTVYDVEFTADGSQLISAGADRTVRTWSSDHHSGTHTLFNEGNLVIKVAFASDTQLLMLNDRLLVRDAGTGDAVRVFEKEGEISAVNWPHGCTKVAGSGPEGRVVVWDATTGRKVLNASVGSVPLRSIALSNDGQLVAAGDDAGFVYLMDTLTGKKRLQFQMDGGQVKNVAIAPDGNTVYAGSTLGAVRAWDSHTGELRKTYSTSLSTYAMALSNDGTRLAAAGPTPEILVWDTQSGEQVAELVGHNIQVFSLDISPDGSRLIAAGSDKTIELWDLHGRESTLTLDGHQDAVISVAYSPTGDAIVSTSRDGTTKIWNASRDADAFRSTSLTSNSASTLDAVWVAADAGSCPPSTSSLRNSMVVIENRLEKDLALFWSDGVGALQDWGRVPAGTRRQVATYSGHAWAISNADGIDLGHVVAGGAPGLVSISATGVVVQRLDVEQTFRIDVNNLESLNIALRNEPDHPILLGHRGMWLGAHGRWEEATADLTRSVQLAPLELTTRCSLSTLLAYQKQLSAYEKNCREILETWTKTDDPRTCERAAKACLLLPEAVDREKVDQLVQKALSVPEDYVFYQYVLMLKGLHLLRNEDFTAAIEACEKSRNLCADPIYSVVICTDFVIEAQAHYRLNQPDSAREALGAAQKMFDTELPEPGNTAFPFWSGWLIARILFEEADSLIHPK